MSSFVPVSSFIELSKEKDLLAAKPSCRARGYLRPLQRVARKGSGRRSYGKQDGRRP